MEWRGAQGRLLRKWLWEGLLRPGLLRIALEVVLKIALGKAATPAWCGLRDERRERSRDRALGLFASAAESEPAAGLAEKCGG